MREIAEMFVPKSMYAAVPVRMLPPVRTLTGLAGWGATAGFGLFWMIGDESFAWAKSLVVGGEEEAQDHWHDKWEAHRRTSLDEADRAAEHRSMVRAMTTHAGTKTKAVAAGLAAPGEVYKTAAAAPLRPKPATTATSTTQDDPWRAVFNPGRNMNMRAVGASKFDKPVAGDGKSVNHHLLQSQSAAAAPAAKKEDGSVNAEDIYKSTYWG